MIEQQQCRVCWEIDNNTENRLINPCKCSGSIKYIHESCLIKQYDYKKDDKCEICKTKFKYALEPFSSEDAEILVNKAFAYFLFVIYVCSFVGMMISSNED